MESFPASPTRTASVCGLPPAFRPSAGFSPSLLGHPAFCCPDTGWQSRDPRWLLSAFCWFDEVDFKHSCCAKVSSLLQEENQLLFRVHRDASPIASLSGRGQQALPLCLRLAVWVVTRCQMSQWKASSQGPAFMLPSDFCWETSCALGVVCIVYMYRFISYSL